RRLAAGDQGAPRRLRAGAPARRLGLPLDRRRAGLPPDARRTGPPSRLPRRGRPRRSPRRQRGAPVRLRMSDLYRTMLLIRRFEERVVELVNANEIAGVTHEYVGQEAVATGICAALRPDDIITSTHRGHGHLIAKGAEVRGMMAELLGRVDGLNRARGGSMHIADLSLGIYGANGIVAAGAPFAAGAAWAGRQDGTDVVAATFFGEGGANQGVLHETMNLSALWGLPVIFVCEN